MNIDIPYYFFKLFEKDTTSFICQGGIKDEVIEKTIRIGEHSIRAATKFTNTRKKVSFLISESLKNLIKHEEKPEIVHQTNNRPGTFMVRNIKDNYYIVTSNLIKNENVDIFKYHLNKINGLEEAEAAGGHNVRISYDLKKAGKNDHGLGLAEMAKRSGHQLEYDFEHVNFYLACFYLQIKLKVNNSIADNVSLPNSREIFRNILEDNMILMHKGNFSQESMLPVLGMIESGFKKGAKQVNEKKRIFYFVVELLQNISKHGLEINNARSGILAVCKKDKGYYIYSGNLIDPMQVDELKSYLDTISKMDKDQLAALYKEHLFDGKPRVKGGAGLGLIDMLRYSTDKPVYNFRPYDSKSVFYSFGFSI